MTGLEHYREAERGIQLATESDDYEHSAYLLARAQVHATLARAAAAAGDWERDDE